MKIGLFAMQCKVYPIFQERIRAFDPISMDFPKMIRDLDPPSSKEEIEGVAIEGASKSMVDQLMGLAASIDVTGPQTTDTEVTTTIDVLLIVDATVDPVSNSSPIANLFTHPKPRECIWPFTGVYSCGGCRRR